MDQWWIYFSIPVGIVLIAGLILIYLIKRHQTKTTELPDSRYTVTELQTKPEWFYFDTVLVPHFSQDYYIWTQVSVNRLLACKYNDRADFLRINGKSVDYVLCHKR